MAIQALLSAMSHIITPLHTIASLFVFPHFVIFSLLSSLFASNVTFYILFAPLETVARHIVV